jgi:hypothetical protein
MSFHAGIVAIRGANLDVDGVAAALALTNQNADVSFADATLSSATDCYLACHGEWVIGANVMNWFWLVETHGDYLRGLAAALPDAEICFVLMEGTSSTYVFGVARDGVVVRETVVAEGQRVVDEGATTTWEADAMGAGHALDDDGEDFVFALLETIVAPFDTLDALSFAAHARA